MLPDALAVLVNGVWATLLRVYLTVYTVPAVRPSMVMLPVEDPQAVGLLAVAVMLGVGLTVTLEITVVEQLVAVNAATIV